MKMKSISLTVHEVKNVRHISGTWRVSDYRRLLALLEMDGAGSYADAEVTEMALMALQEYEVEEAMEMVLATCTGNQFANGCVVQHIGSEAWTTTMRASAIWIGWKSDLAGQIFQIRKRTYRAGIPAR